MNFGAEGERLQQIRRKQVQDYANELRRQMSEKRKRKTTTPAMYSTTSGDSYSGQALKVPKRSARPEKSNGNNAAIIVPPKLPSRSFELSPRQKAVPDFSPTAVPTLNVQIHEPDQPLLQSLVLPPADTATIDPSRFSSRLHSIEQLLTQQRKSLQSSTETTKRLTENSVPHLSSGLDDLTGRIHKVATVDMRAIVTSASDGVATNKSYVESLNSNLGSTISDMTAKLDEITASLPHFITRTDDANNKHRKMMTKMTSDGKKEAGQDEILIQKIMSLESRRAACDSTNGQLRVNFDRISPELSQLYEQMQKSVANAMETAANRYVEAITAESDALQTSATAIGNHCVAIHEFATESLSSLNEAVGDLTGNLRDAASSLSNSISEALNKTQDEVETLSTEISQKLDGIIASTEENFKAIQGESVATIQAMKTSITEMRDSIASSIEEEAKKFGKTPKEVIDKYESFEKLILNEIVLQREKCDELFGETQKKCSEAVHHMLYPPQAEVSLMSQAQTNIDRAEAAISKLEDQFRIANAQIQDSIGTLTQNYEKLSKTFRSLNKSTNSNFTKIEGKIDKIETARNIKLAETKEELQKFAQDFYKTTESRIDTIETQLKSQFSRTGKLTLRRRKRRHTKAEHPSIEIAQLVDKVSASETPQEENIEPQAPNPKHRHRRHHRRHQPTTC